MHAVAVIKCSTVYENVVKQKLHNKVKPYAFEKMATMSRKSCLTFTFFRFIVLNSLHVQWSRDACTTCTTPPHRLQVRPRLTVPRMGEWERLIVYYARLRHSVNEISMYLSMAHNIRIDSYRLTQGELHCIDRKYYKSTKGKSNFILSITN